VIGTSLRQLRPWHWTALDCVVAVLLAVSALEPYQVTGAGAPRWWGPAVAVTACLPVAVRRRFPVGVTVLVVVATSAEAALGFSKVPYLALAYALYVVATQRPRRIAVAGLVASGVSVGVYLVAGVAYQPGNGTALLADRLTAVSGSALTVAAAFAMGVAVRAHGRYVAGIAGRAVTEERLRIARELHDIVAHSMSVIAVQAGVGHYLLDEQPDQARTALDVIETTSRDALVEMRHLLGVLRGEDAERGSGTETADRGRLRPSPGIKDLPALVTSTTATGTTTEVTVTGTERQLPTGIELAAYRIVQEALTNVVKHAQARHCAVSVHYGDEELALVVVDDGTGRPPAGGGHGLIGMRERVGVYGGRLSAGPRPDRGFQVCASIPLPGGAA
jgi:signal transduction histidine kinase